MRSLVGTKMAKYRTCAQCRDAKTPINETCYKCWDDSATVADALRVFISLVAGVTPKAEVAERAEAEELPCCLDGSCDNANW
jgi:hypothetical protein